MKDEDNKRPILGGMMLAVYAYFGFLILLITHGVWNESKIELGAQVLYHFTVVNGLQWSVLAIFGAAFIFFATYDAKRHEYVIRCLGKIFRKEISKAARALVPSVVNLVFCCITFVLYSLLIPGFFNAFAICFVFLNAGLIGVSTFYYIAPPCWKVFADNGIKKTEHEIEALKLEHAWIWQAIYIISWVSVILAATVVFGAWTQVTYPSIASEQRDTWAVLHLQAMTAIQLIYIVCGLWFGVLGPLMDYSWRVRQRIAQI